MSSLSFYIILFYSWVMFLFFFFSKQKTAYEMGISDWSSDVCSSDLASPPCARRRRTARRNRPCGRTAARPDGRPWPRKTASSGGCAVRGTSGSGQGAAAGPLVCPKPSPDSKPGCVRCAIHATWQRGAFLCYTLPYVDFRGVRRGRARPFPHEGRGRIRYVHCVDSCRRAVPELSDRIARDRARSSNPDGEKQNGQPPTATPTARRRGVRGLLDDVHRRAGAGGRRGCAPERQLSTADHARHHARTRAHARGGAPGRPDPGDPCRPNEH